MSLPATILAVRGWQNQLGPIRVCRSFQARSRVQQYSTMQSSFRRLCKSARPNLKAQCFRQFSSDVTNSGAGTDHTTAASVSPAPQDRNHSPSVDKLLSVLRKTSAASRPAAPQLSKSDFADILDSFPDKRGVLEEDKLLSKQKYMEDRASAKPKLSSASRVASSWLGLTDQDREPSSTFSMFDAPEDLLDPVDSSVRADAAAGSSKRKRRQIDDSAADSLPIATGRSSLTSGAPRTRPSRRVRPPSDSELESWPPRISTDPFKIVVLNVEPSANDEDIRQGFRSLDLDREVQITRVERYVELRSRSAKTVNAFVSLATEGDYNLLMADTVRPFGVYVRGARCTYAPCEQRRTVFIRGLSKVETESAVRQMLKLFSIDVSQVEKVEFMQDEAGNVLGACTVQFASHSEAYKAIKYLNNIAGKQRFTPLEMTMAASWGRQDILHELRKRKDDLDRENRALKEQIARLNDEVKKIEQVETVSDVRLSAVIFKHITKVLETTNFDKTQAAQLLDVSPSKFSRLLTDLKRDGLEIKDDRFPAKRFRVRNSTL